MTTEERFWAKVRKPAGLLSCTPTTCWIWTASKRAKGYGAFTYKRDGKVVHDRAHRYSWELHFGPIPEGMCVLHECDNPPCVRPDHLFLGTKADNNADMHAKGRAVAGGTYGGNYPVGVDHHGAKLNADIVQEIRALKATLSYSQLSARFGLAIGHLHRIVTRKAWSHVA